MSHDPWSEHAADTLRKFVLWWESDSPGRRLDAYEAHELANVVMAAKGLIEEFDERQGTSEPPGTHKGA